MHTVKNISNGPRDLKTSAGLLVVQHGEEVTAEFEPTYLRLLRNGMSFDVEKASEEAVQAASGSNRPADVEKSTEQRQNGSVDASEPTDRDGWADLAASKGIEVKKSWGINRIKTEIEKAS